MFAQHSRYLIISMGAVLPLGFAAHAATYEVHGDVAGAISYYRVKKNDNLSEIARHFDIGIVELLTANPGVNARSLWAGAILTIVTMHVLPVSRQGIVLNLSELRLFYFPDARHVMTFPVGIGREGWNTPLGSTRIIKKREHPTWTPPDSIRVESPHLPKVVPAGPDNPLGQYALTLAMPGYAIHGTNRPYSVGKRSSHGCIRLYPEDIAVLFNAVQTDTSVAIIDTPYKLGWQGNNLLLEITPTQQQADAIEQYQEPHPINLPEVDDAIKQLGEATDINWKTVDQTTSQRNGIPTIIGNKSTVKRLLRQLF